MLRGWRLDRRGARSGGSSDAQHPRYFNRVQNYQDHAENILNSSIFIFLVMSSICLAIWWVNVQFIDLKIAWGGFSPIAWVYKSELPINYSRDFPGGIETYDVSAFMHVYKLAYAFLGVTPESLLPIIIGLEIIVTAWAVYSLCRALMLDMSRIGVMLTIVWIISSYVGNLSLAGWDLVFFNGQYYTAADVMRIFSIIMFLKNRPELGSVLLAGSFITHPGKGFSAGVFIVAMHLRKPKEMFRKSYYYAASIFAIIAISWFLLMYSDVKLSGDKVSNDLWINATRLFTAHWYPVDYGHLTVEHERRFIPFISFCILYSFYYDKNITNKINNIKILYGMMSMLIVSIIGIFVSYLYPSPFVIKLCLQRGLDLFVVIAVIYVFCGLWNELKTNNIWRITLAMTTIISPFVYPPGLPLLLSALIAVPSFMSIARGRMKNNDIVTTLLVVVGTAIVGVYSFYHMTGPWYSRAYTGGMDIFRTAAYVFSACFMSLLLRYCFKTDLIYLMCVIIVLLYSSIWIKDQKPASEYVPLASSYKEVQLWARYHTPADALFMTDPTIYYGWRDYSRRSSFGNIREWAYSSWVYNQQMSKYMMGIQRVDEFGVNLRDYYDERPLHSGCVKLTNKIKELYYSYGDDWRMTLARKYGINYFVMVKSLVSNPSMMHVAYDNKYFQVLEARIQSEPSRSWHPVIDLDFDLWLPDNADSINWHIWPSPVPSSMQWGLANDGYSGKYGLYFKQPDENAYWLYSGNGPLTEPPSSDLVDDVWRIKRFGKYRIGLFMKGCGFADLYVWWYDQRGRSHNTQLIHQYRLFDSYEHVFRIFELPEGTKSFRVAFLIRESRDRMSMLNIDNVRIEIYD